MTGVGQSEYAVSNMVDIFILLLPPGGGDELQGVKRGIVEKADLLVVTKADGDLLAAAHRTQYEYTAAIKFMRPNNPKWKTRVKVENKSAENHSNIEHQCNHYHYRLTLKFQVLPLSSKTKTGLEPLWDQICKFRETTKEDFILKRGEQRAVWMWTHVQEGLERILLQDPRLKELTTTLLENVRDGKISPGSASDEILSLFSITSGSN